MSAICLRYQQVRGDRLVFSCECAGEGCPDQPPSRLGGVVTEPSCVGLPTENARLYAREFAAEQLRNAAKWAEANGYDEAAVDHLIRKAMELWP